MAIFFSLVIALPVGIVSGIRPESDVDQILRSFAILLVTVPAFWLGTMVRSLPGAVVGMGAAAVLRPIR